MVMPTSSFANQAIIEEVNCEIEESEKKSLHANKFCHKQKSFGDLVNSHSNQITIRKKPDHPIMANWSVA